MKMTNGSVLNIIDNQTLKVNVDRVWLHPLYKKQVKRSKKYLVHFTGSAPKVGEKVTIQSCRPISKWKRFILVIK